MPRETRLAESPCFQRLAVATGLAIVLAAFCIRVWSFDPKEFLGFYHDDLIYFTTAKAIAAGQGYVIPSFPGVLPQTKYPILYPLILATVWRIWPAYPQNLQAAIAVSIAIACAFLVLSYGFFRAAGLSQWLSLSAVGVIGMHPGLALLAGNLLSDYLFATLMLASAMTADAMINRPESDRFWGATTGVLLGLILLVRSAGIGIAGGILLYAALHRRWRATSRLVMALLLIVSMGTLATKLAGSQYVPAGTGVPPVGFQHVLAYYCSYIQMWRLSVPNASVFGSMIWNNLRWLMLAPGNYFILAGSSLPQNTLTTALALLVTTMSVGGVVRWFPSTRYRAIIFIFLGSFPILLLWNYPIYDRFLIPFLPLIVLGVIVEVRRVMRVILNGLQSDPMDRIAALPVAGVLLALVLVAGYNYWHYRSDLMELSRHRVKLNTERREVYDWISQHTSASARIIAYEDGLVYLYTGRQSVRPVAITTECYYQPERTRCVSDFSEMGTWLGYVSAMYWLSDTDDLEFEGQRRFRPEVQKHIADLKAIMRPIFVSSKGSVILYDTTCLIDTDHRVCRKKD